MLISKAARIILTGYYGGLQGEEIGKTHLGGIKKYWLEGMSHWDHFHIMLVLSVFFYGKSVNQDVLSAGGNKNKGRKGLGDALC